MTDSLLTSLDQRRRLWIGSLILASVLFTFGFACALPLAAFAAIAALTSGRREALALTTAIWFANQLVGFVFLHYPIDAATFAWGGALGVIALLCCETARWAARRSSGVLAYGAALVAGFIVYEGSLFAIGMAMGGDAEHFAFATVSRIFLINVCAFLGLWALSALEGAIGTKRRQAPGLAASA